jgi:arabinogalactan endo-1,4-beta-galactosidase
MSRFDNVRRVAEYTESDAWNKKGFYEKYDYSDYWRSPEEEEWPKEWD